MKRGEQRKLELNKNFVKLSYNGQLMNINNDRSPAALNSSDSDDYNKQSMAPIVKKILKIFSFYPNLEYA